MQRVDHLIPLELGGDNVIANLWPEPAEPLPGFHEKDRVENYLHRQVCAGAMRLVDAQRQIATDWLVVKKRMDREPNASTTWSTNPEGCLRIGFEPQLPVTMRVLSKWRVTQ